ncbi:MAG: hypothetical protein RBU21_01770, partial [FCB group bacterium]|nr:hypothetical protein [FCB group bacterium]
MSVFLSELVAMGLVHSAGLSSPWLEMLADSTLLVLILVPTMYVLMARPLVHLLTEEASARQQESIVRSEVSYIEDALKESNIELQRFNRLFSLLSHVNQAVARATDEKSLFDEICRILEASGDFSRAWIGMIDEADAKTLRPVAGFGHEEGYPSV